ncbi:four-helix bundle copper-binding protein, partial [Leclercia sp. Colony189]
ANICRLAAQFMTFDSEFARSLCRVCAEVCQKCGEECGKHEAEHCQKCSE